MADVGPDRVPLAPAVMAIVYVLMAKEAAIVASAVAGGKVWILQSRPITGKRKL